MGEDDCKIGGAGVGELVMVVNVKSGKDGDMTRGLQNVLGTPRLEPRVFA